MKFGSNKSVLKYLTCFPERLKCGSNNEISTEDEVYNLVRDIFKDHSSSFSSNICFWTSPFSKAFSQCYSSLAVAWMTDKINCDGHYKGIVIDSYPVESHIFFSFDFSGGSFHNVFYVEFACRKLIALCFDTQIATEGKLMYIDPIMGGTEIGSLLHRVFLREVFKKYCKLETKLLPPKASFKDFRCKYINLLPDNVTILDSKWFTNLVQSQGFNVRGHFRFQACGSGMQERTLIWIDDFKKDGYRAPARRLLPQNQKFINPVDKPTP